MDNENELKSYLRKIERISRTPRIGDWCVEKFVDMINECNRLAKEALSEKE